MYEKIMVPIDGSKRGERALHHVEELAINNGSHVFLLMATPLEGRKPSAHDSEYYLNSLERQKISAEAYLKAIQNALMQKKVKVTGILEFGNTIESILKTAEDEGPDLIVIPTHGKRANGKLLNKTETPILFISS